MFSRCTLVVQYVRHICCRLTSFRSGAVLEIYTMRLKSCKYTFATVSREIRRFRTCGQAHWIRRQILHHIYFLQNLPHIVTFYLKIKERKAEMSYSASCALLYTPFVRKQGRLPYVFSMQCCCTICWAYFISLANSCDSKRSRDIYDASKTLQIHVCCCISRTKPFWSVQIGALDSPSNSASYIFSTAFTTYCHFMSRN